MKEKLQQSRQLYAIQDKINMQKMLKCVTTGYVMLIWKCIPGVVIPEISNSNWTEWSIVQGVIALVISKSDERKARGRFEITSTITP